MSEPILKLDELVGRAKPLKVERLGKTYDLIRPEGLTLKQNVEWQEMAKKIALVYGPLGKAAGMAKQVSIENTIKVVDDCLRMICSAILLEEKSLSMAQKFKAKFIHSYFEDRHPFSFDEKLKVLEFYIAEALSGKTSTKAEGRKRHSTTSRTGSSGVSADEPGNRKNRTGA